MAPKTILHIEDEPVIRALLMQQMSREGHSVISQDSVSAGRPHFPEKNIDLVVTDLQMPGESGHQVVEWFLKNRPEVPIIVFSANATMPNRMITAVMEAEAESAGVVYIPKPEFVKLFQVIEDKLQEVR